MILWNFNTFTIFIDFVIFLAFSTFSILINFKTIWRKFKTDMILSKVVSFITLFTDSFTSFEPFLVTKSFNIKVLINSTMFIAWSSWDWNTVSILISFIIFYTFSTSSIIINFYTILRKFNTDMVWGEVISLITFFAEFFASLEPFLMTKSFHIRILINSTVFVTWSSRNWLTITIFIDFIMLFTFVTNASYFSLETMLRKLNTNIIWVKEISLFTFFTDFFTT